MFSFLGKYDFANIEENASSSKSSEYFTLAKILPMRGLCQWYPW